MEPYTNYTINADDYYEIKIAEEQDELNDQLIELSFKVFNLFLKFIRPQHWKKCCRSFVKNETNKVNG